MREELPGRPARSPRRHRSCSGGSPAHRSNLATAAMRPSIFIKIFRNIQIIKNLIGRIFCPDRSRQTCFPEISPSLAYYLSIKAQLKYSNRYRYHVNPVSFLQWCGTAEHIQINILLIIKGVVRNGKIIRNKSLS